MWREPGLLAKCSAFSVFVSAKCWSNCGKLGSNPDHTFYEKAGLFWRVPGLPACDILGKISTFFSTGVKQFYTTICVSSQLQLIQDGKFKCMAG